MPGNSPSTAAQSPAPRWVRYLVPSVSDLVFIVLLVALTYGATASRLLGDAGIGWHIRNGQQMLQTHSITRTDSFSSTMNGQAWYAWEWLYDLGIASIHGWLGLNGVVLVTATIIAATFAFVLRIALCRGGSLPPTVVLLMLSLGASAIHWLARPHVLSWLFAVVWFQVVDSWESATTDRNRRLFWLPVLMVGWVNLHGGFLVGFLLLGVYLAGNLIEYFTCSKQREIGNRLKQLGTVALLSLLASLVNPFGYQLHVHIYQYLSNRFLMNHIEEFRSPNFHGAAEQCFVALLLITIVVLAIARSKPRASQVLVILFAAASGLYASRNLPVSSMLLVLIVAPLLSRAVVEASADEGVASWLRGFFSRCDSFTSRMGRMELNLRSGLWPVVAVIMSLAICLQHGRLGSRELMDAQFDAKRFPVQAVEAISQREMISGPIFCPDYWGGYLIYRLYPQARVFMDDRHDLYGEAFLKEYLKVIRVQPGWERVLSDGQVGFVLVPRESALATILRQTKPWIAIHEDEAAVLFQNGLRE